MIKVLLVDDKVSTRIGLRLRLALEPDIRVEGEAQDGMEALQLAKALHPDVVVMDAKMKRLDGISATERLREVVPDVSVVILTIHSDAVTQARAMAAGAAAFVEKTGSIESLLAEIRRVAQ
jgi:two-component system response regulator NreC